jgi:NAD-dependent SIR2 family protein deacetylase
VSELHGSLWRLSVPREDGEDAGADDLSAFFAGGGREELLRQWSRENERTVWENREVPFPAIPPSPEPGLRPDVVLFGEEYGNRLLWVEHFIDQGVDAVLVVGCSGGVYVLFDLLRRVRTVNPAAAVINVNPHEDCLEGEHLFVRAAAAPALSALRAALPAGTA